MHDPRYMSTLKSASIVYGRINLLYWRGANVDEQIFVNLKTMAIGRLIQLLDLQTGLPYFPVVSVNELCLFCLYQCTCETVSCLVIG